jgi:hypothetical protein
MSPSSLFQVLGVHIFFVLLFFWGVGHSLESHSDTDDDDDDDGDERSLHSKFPLEPLPKHSGLVILGSLLMCFFSFFFFFFFDFSCSNKN